MDSPDDDRAIDRYVAGMPVDRDELSREVTARAVDAAIVVDALLRGLAHESAVVRTRTTRRIAEMVEVPPRLVAELRRLALADVNRRVREAAAAALDARGLEVVEGAAPPKVTRLRRFPSLWLMPRTLRGAVRSTEPVRVVLLFRAREREEAPALRGQLLQQGDELRIQLDRLPEAYVGLRLAVYAGVTASGEETPVAVAEESVGPTGTVSLPVAAGLGSAEEIAALLATAFELAVIED